ncbi:alpha/beta fold hydrolase [Streptomyces roseicoloratus]|uniref:Alpha/beta fold hydrolase n=1 Tax=Streptomyces roseicoloratus TaxID=2508722 RepID=A0ABY9RXF0_9ACTN|nr:alpha/beta fold hydrolase [Streptomyces roseicoloratus]WMX45884.1 alpha/beta fold hydrolase [Streptomyces roseicoloratus]
MSSEAEGRFHIVDVSQITSRPLRDTVRTHLRTADGVRIEAVYEPSLASVTDTAADAPAGPASGPATETPAAAAAAVGTAIVVAHGFTGSVDRPALRRAAQVFRRHANVVTFSFRGHGGSGGLSTVGDREVLDLAAAVRWARELGNTRVVTVGFSMGGSVVLRHAALERDPRQDTDAVAAVSAPARWYYRGTPSMRRVHWVITRPAGRLVGRYGLRTRIDHKPWDPVPLAPYEAVPMIGPTPLLVVHGDRDPYFPVDHPRMLTAAAEAAGTPVELWLERGMGHAENAAADELLDRLGTWLTRP